MIEQPLPPAPAAPPAGDFGVTSPQMSRRPRPSWLAPLLVVAGLVGGIAVYASQQINYRRRVENLERAVSGYKTTLTFQRAGDFTLYYEYRGTFNAMFDGDQEELTIDAPERRPKFTTALLDDAGTPVDLDLVENDVTYDVAGFVGRSYRTAKVTSAGDYLLEVVPEPGNDEFAISIGIGTIRRPSRALPALLALLGVGAGLGLWLTGRRRPPAAMSGPAAGAPPMPYTITTSTHSTTIPPLMPVPGPPSQAPAPPARPPAPPASQPPTAAQPLPPPAWGPPSLPGE